MKNKLDIMIAMGKGKPMENPNEEALKLLQSKYAKKSDKYKELAGKALDGCESILPEDEEKDDFNKGTLSGDEISRLIKALLSNSSAGGKNGI